MGDMDAFFLFLDTLVQSLDVYGRRPQLAPNHVPPRNNAEETPARGELHPP
jgi:hypothetical protein